MVAPIIAALLPTIVSALGQPIVAGTAASWIAKKFGLSDSTVEGITNFINGLKPDEQVRLKEMDLEFQRYCMEHSIRLDLAQIEINREEAKHESIFIAGGRPFIMWVCGVGFAYLTVVEPIARFIASVGFGYTGGFPTIDTGLLVTTLGGLLGLGSLRTYEKIKKVNKNR